MSSNDPRPPAGSPYQTPPLAAEVVGPQASNTLGVVGLILSILGLVTCGLVSPFGVICSGIALFKRPRTAAGFGTAIGLAGCLLAVVVGTVVGRFVMETTTKVKQIAADVEVELKAQQQTIGALQAAEKAIHDWQTEHTGELPDLATGQELIAEFRDGWHRPLEFQLKESTFDIRSSGRDETFGTDDDEHASMFAMPPDPKAAADGNKPEDEDDD